MTPRRIYTIGLITLVPFAIQMVRFYRHGGGRV